MKTNYSLLFLFILGLVSCSTHQPVQISAITDTPIAIMTISNTPSLAITPAPTYDSWCWKKEKECEIAQRLGVNIQQIESFSPNMQWAVIYLGGMRFVKVDGSKEWEFNSSQMREDIGECGYFLEINFWSLDSRYVYFSPDPSYCSRMFNYSDVGTQVLYRLDVEAGTIEEYLPFVKYRFSSGYERWGLYTFEFSPDGRYLVYFQSYGSPMIINIKNLTTKDEITYELDNKYLEAGCPAWMDDAVHVLFYAATTTHPGDPTLASLFFIDLKEQTIQAIYHDEPNVYCAIGNPYFREENPDATNLIPVRVLDIGYQQLLDQFYLDPLAGQKIPWATITPYPSSTPRP